MMTMSGCLGLQRGCSITSVGWLGLGLGGILFIYIDRGGWWVGG